MIKLLDFLQKESLNFKNYYLAIILALFLNLLIWLMSVLRIPPSADWIPLHYHVFFGIDWFGPWTYILIYPAIGLFLIILNCVLAFILRIKEPFLSKILIWQNIVVQVLILTFLTSLILNFFS